MSCRKIFAYFLLLHVVSLFFISFCGHSVRNLDSSSDSSMLVSETSAADLYSFENPRLAYEILTQLDIFESGDDGVSKGVTKFNRSFLGLAADDYYCYSHRAHFVESPHSLFEQVNFFLETEPTTFLRSKIIPSVGTDFHPEIGKHMPSSVRKAKTSVIQPETTVFVTTLAMNEFVQVGKQFSCLSQMSNHIPGHDTLNRKDYVAESAIAYAEGYENRPQCFNDKKFFPKTWLMYNREDCEDFFAEFNSQEYQRLKAEQSIVYIRKVGVGSHRGEGVQPVNDKEEAKLREMYGNGKLCGQVKRNYILQTYVHNPLLLNGRKFDFRMYMLVASVNPTMVYYHDGYLRVSLADYDVESNDKKSLLTNLALSKQIYADAQDGNLFEGMDPEALRHAQQWDFERLKDYLVQVGKVTDPMWLDNYLRPEFKKAMVHLVRMGAYAFKRGSSFFELYGVDFMLDDNLGLWFIEANSGPAFGEYTPVIENVVGNMLKDHFEIVVGLLRSRMKRVINYVNKIADEGEAVLGANNIISIKNLNQKRDEFKAITRNYFEEEFEPKASNGFSKIIDENYVGVAKYMGYLTEECM